MEKKSLAEYIVGRRIQLKKHKQSIAEVLFKCIEKDRERLAKFLPWVPYIKTIEDERFFIESTLKNWASGEVFDYGIFLLEKDICIGSIGVHSINWNFKGAELGYWILGEYEGKGFMTEAVKLLESHLFDMGFHRIEIRCSALNERSAGVPLRCNYVFEGTARENVIEHEEFRSTKIFSKLATEHIKET